ncbi:synaptic vesicle 2-related protein, partial [Andrena cerasifolii]|uniref:synaptic vesicle 2-related protein n=1 Tax=Andrena cerasifolii TaxID=2819439 RepID=UPI004037A6EE
IGMAIGAFLFGIIIDAIGRKVAIPVTMVIVFCASISLSFAQTVFLVNLCIFILGLGLAGNNVVIRVYLIEFLPTKQRGRCLVILDTLGIMGSVSTLGLSWLLLPSVIRFQNKRFRPYSWRVVTGLGGIPNLIMACVMGLLPASPRYLLYRRRQEEAIAVLQQMYAINNSKHANTYSVNNLDNCVTPDDEDDDNRNNFVKAVRKFCIKTYTRLRMLFEPRFRRTTKLGICIGFLQVPGIIWLALWITRLLQEMEKFDKAINKSSTCTIDLQHITLGMLHDCQEVDNDCFTLLLYLSGGYMLGEVLLLAGIDVIGRKAFLAVAGVMEAAALLILLFRIHSATRIVLSFVILGTYAISRTTSTILLLENYSTGLRGTIIGLTSVLPHLVAAVTKFLGTIHCSSSIIFMSGISLGAAIAGSQMPDLTRLPMQE